MTYNEFNKIFHSIVENPNDFIVSKEASPSQPVFNLGKRQGSQSTYAIKFFTNKDVCLVWDYQRHRAKKDECGAGTSSLSLNGGKKWDGLETGHDVFYPCYKQLGKKTHGLYEYEKVYVVGASHLAEFLKHYQRYMAFNNEDKSFPQNAVEDQVWIDDNERKKYSSLQYQRDKHFRDEVLAAYNHKCVVCRCSVDEVLQAAHDHSHPFAKTGCLAPEFGICLCANHHLMYDSFLIDLDTNELKLTVTNEGKRVKVDQMSWYKEFMKVYEGKLLGRNPHV